MKRNSTLAVFGLIFTVAGCPPVDDGSFPNQNLPMDNLDVIDRAAPTPNQPDKLVIFERAAQTANQPDKLVIFERAAQTADQPRDESAVKPEQRPPVRTVEPADPNVPWPANSSGESQQTPGATGTPESDK